MKGYNSIIQFVQDYKLYIAAKKIDPGKEGETITSYLKKRIDKRISSSSSQFKAMLKKRNYSIIYYIINLYAFSALRKKLKRVAL